jgi:hypothetical protein
MAIICGTEYSSNRFTWSPESRSLIAEVSDLNHPEPFARVFDDALDVGFKVRSEKTGKVVLFILWQEHHNADSELTWWEFRPHPRSTLDVTVTVFND